MKNSPQNSRPENLDERVFFGEELSTPRFINERDLLYLHLDKKSARAAVANNVRMRIG